MQMALPAAVQKLLEMGGEHEVEGSIIRVQRFERQTEAAMNAAAAEGGLEEEHVQEEQAKAQSGRKHWARQGSITSSTSVSTGSMSVKSDATNMSESSTE